MSKKHRRKGIGSILLQHVEEIVKSRVAYCLLMLRYVEDYDTFPSMEKTELAL
ncbi:GNAT family N-acetyltransferase [Paenibacillus sp. GCM10012306]|uniref:GNAT family N-acetyltransferase n=1 Tax=Paenibacillus sp. GCM10012306 TaxID=3317342 RepID=UPI00361DFE49